MDPPLFFHFNSSVLRIQGEVYPVGWVIFHQSYLNAICFFFICTVATFMGAGFLFVCAGVGQLILCVQTTSVIPALSSIRNKAFSPSVEALAALTWCGEYSLNWPGQMSLAQLTTSVRGVCGTAKRQWWCFSSVCSPAPVCLVLLDSELKLGFAFWKPWNPKAPNHFLSSEKSLGLLVSVKCSAFGFWENSHLIALSLYCHKHMKPCLQSGAIT